MWVRIQPHQQKNNMKRNQIRRRTPKEIDERKQYRKNKVEELSLEYQLGFYVGEYIFHTTLPTLSCDPITTRNIIHVSEEETNELKKLNDIWYEKYFEIKDSDQERDKHSNNEWINLVNYQKMLDDKYYPKTIETYLSPLNVTNIDRFKSGLISSLWNSDCCHYSLKDEDITIKTDDNYLFTIITLLFIKL